MAVMQKYFTVSFLNNQNSLKCVILVDLPLESQLAVSQTTKSFQKSPTSFFPKKKKASERFCLHCMQPMPHLMACTVLLKETGLGRGESLCKAITWVHPLMTIMTCHHNSRLYYDDNSRTICSAWIPGGEASIGEVRKMFKGFVFLILWKEGKEGCKKILQGLKAQHSSFLHSEAILK